MLKLLKQSQASSREAIYISTGRKKFLKYSLTICFLAKNLKFKCDQVAEARARLKKKLLYFVSTTKWLLILDFMDMSGGGGELLLSGSDLQDSTAGGLLLACT